MVDQAIHLDTGVLMYLCNSMYCRLWDYLLRHNDDIGCRDFLSLNPALDSRPALSHRGEAYNMANIGQPQALPAVLL
jgi:hypothetical protein